MRLRKLAAVAIGLILHSVVAFAQPQCKPEIGLTNVKLSEAINLRRYWTATLNVEASACAASSGLFALGFVRASESGPDVEFREPLVWRAGQTTVRVEFWWDEAVDRYWVTDIAPCSCGPK